MTPDDALKLCKFAKSACPAQAIDQDTPAAWFVLLNDLNYNDAMAALVNVVKTQPFVSPAEIRAEVKKLRAARITAFGPMPPPPPEVANGTESDYIAWLKDSQTKIADGTVTKPEQLAIDTAPRKPRKMQMIETFKSIKRDMDPPVEPEFQEPEVIEGVVVEPEDGGEAAE